MEEWTLARAGGQTEAQPATKEAAASGRGKEQSGSLEKLHKSGARQLGFRGRQYFWKIVFKIICSRMKRQERPRIGEALVRISQGI